jgi:hypothetical protein
MPGNQPRSGETDGPNATNATSSRRSFLERAAVVGVPIAAGALAGCAGDGGGSGGDGGSGDGDGGSGDGGSMNGSDGGDRPTLNLTSFPLNYDGVVATYMEREGILREKMDEVGFDYNLEFVFEDIPQFVSGQSDHVNMGTLETARLAAERDIPLAQVGRIDSTFYGPMVRADSDLSVSNTGSIEASLRKISEENRRIAILGWGIGYIPAEQVFMRTQFDMTFSEDGGDFDNVVTADAGAIPEFIVNGEVDVGMIAPTSSPADAWYNDEIEPLYWDADVIIEAGLGSPLLSGPVFKQETMVEKGDGVQAYMDALEEACTWFYEEGRLSDGVPSDPELYEKLNAPGSEIAQWQCDWLTAWYTGNDVKYALENPTGYRQPKLDDEFIENDREYVDNAHEFGLVSENWSEDSWDDMVVHEKL